MVRPWPAALAGLAAGLLLGIIAAAAAQDGSRSIYHDGPSGPRVKTLTIDPADDADKPGRVHGVMGWRFFDVPLGRSRQSQHELRFRFAAPAKILQMDLSVDITDPRASVVEFAAGINAEEGYGFDGRRRGFDRKASWLMHASWVRAPGAPAAIDETTRLPDGVRVRAGDFIAFGAWLGGRGAGDPIRVSPEIVILYRWL
jgi:hypothetical protein